MIEYLSRAEIAYWVRELINEQIYGWSKDEKLLAEFLGFSNRYFMRKYLFYGWRFAEKLQRTVSNNLRRILSGEIVCERRMWRGTMFPHPVSEVRVAENPKPIEYLGPARAVVSIGRHGVQLRVKARIGVTPVSAAMPSFEQIWAGK